MKAYTQTVSTQERPGIQPTKRRLTVVGFGDLQAIPIRRNRPDVTDWKRARRTLEWARDNGAYVIGMGDYVDCMSPSNRSIWKNSGLYDSPRGHAGRSHAGPAW